MNSGHRKIKKLGLILVSSVILIGFIVGGYQIFKEGKKKDRQEQTDNSTPSQKKTSVPKTRPVAPTEKIEEDTNEATIIIEK